MIFPSTACILQAKLGIKNCPAFDVQAVCSGFIYALATADLFIRSGQYQYALVVGAEIYSRILDWNDRGTCVLFGDGAGAVVLKASDTPGILSSHLHADGSYQHILSVPGSVCGGKVEGRPFLQMEGNAVFKFAVKVLDEVVEEALAKNNLQKSDIDWLIPHQANIRIIQSTAKKLGIEHGKSRRHGRSSRQYVGGVDPAGARRGGARRPHTRRATRAAGRRGRRLYLGRGVDEMVRKK